MAYRYQVGGRLRATAPSYVYRHADDRLCEQLQAGEFCYVFNCRQMGKSSLRVRTMQRLMAEGVQCVAVDLTTIGSDQGVTQKQWYEAFIGSLHAYPTLGLSTHIRFTDWWSAHEHLPPVRLLNLYLREVLLEQIKVGQIVIFIDEIDVVLKLGFDASDFFALIRACFNLRADDPEYDRLTFALFGVTTPEGLIQDPDKTPFNLGKDIPLSGFEFERSLVLAEGLVDAVPNSKAVLQAILDWTGGQPFLTQKLCDLVQLESLPPCPVGKEVEWVEQLVRSHIIEDWQQHDDPVHLRTIRDRILRDPQRLGRMLGLYQQILKKGDTTVDDSQEQLELRLSGLVVLDQGRLRAYNRIYQTVFDAAWVEQELANLRPYTDKLKLWLASHDEAYLLKDQELRDQLSGLKGRHLADEDYRFFAASQDLERRNMENLLELAKDELSSVKDEIDITRVERQQAKQDLSKMRILVYLGLGVLGVLGIALSSTAPLLEQQSQELVTLAAERSKTVNQLSQTASKLTDAERQNQNLQQSNQDIQKDNDIALKNVQQKQQELNGVKVNLDKVRVQFLIKKEGLETLQRQVKTERAQLEIVTKKLSGEKTLNSIREQDFRDRKEEIDSLDLDGLQQNARSPVMYIMYIDSNNSEILEQVRKVNGFAKALLVTEKELFNLPGSNKTVIYLGNSYVESIANKKSKQLQGSLKVLDQLGLVPQIRPLIPASQRILNQYKSWLQQGDSGIEVTELQEELGRVGCYDGAVTGYFGTETKKAVITCQIRNGLTPDGIAEIQLGNAPFGKSLREGDSGTAVTELQDRLKALGCFDGSSTGSFDAQTRDAVIQCQQQRGITADGIVGAETYRAFGLGSPGTGSGLAQFGEPLQLGDRGQGVRALQTQLQAKGYYYGMIDGVFGPDTRTAVLQLQSDRGLPQTGVVDDAVYSTLVGGAVPPTTPPGVTGLQFGDQGPRVAELQRQLNRLGYSVPVTGYFGTQTQRLCGHVV
ncbi:peptidoglycan-binding protein [Leptolyngbya sp. NIES-2104]|uniref:peptidoglycan-binding protein n=1 Tax=Leptolyngbya sp. NIES-2104 TaxID=1552121 RepID=UPI0006ECC2DA|nr:peptidoglycan-binding protein [Leptolyngbya sp. NIES-2104]GAQ00094.1 high-affnity carbon uptake protein Hat/HatR [Leptolyngbya sp. NIES-2104]